MVNFLLTRQFVKQLSKLKFVFTSIDIWKWKNEGEIGSGYQQTNHKIFKFGLGWGRLEFWVSDKVHVNKVRYHTSDTSVLPCRNSFWSVVTAEKEMKDNFKGCMVVNQDACSYRDQITLSDKPTKQRAATLRKDNNLTEEKFKCFLYYGHNILW